MGETGAQMLRSHTQGQKKRSGSGFSEAGMEGPLSEQESSGEKWGKET